MTLTTDDLQAIGQLLDEKFDTKFEQKFDEKFSEKFEPIHKQLIAFKDTFVAIDKRFVAIDRQFQAMNDQFQALDYKIDAVYDRLHTDITGVQKVVDRIEKVQIAEISRLDQQVLAVGRINRKLGLA